MCAAMTCVMMGMNVLPCYANEVEAEISGAEKLTVSLTEAEEIAKQHVYLIMSNLEDSKWNEGVKIASERALFDEEQKISAYYLTFEDRNQNPAGYVVINANKTNFPIVEYSDKNTSFIEESSDEISRYVDEKEDAVIIEDMKVYYTGSTNYYLQVDIENQSSEIYDISTAAYKEVDKQDIVSKDTQMEELDKFWKSRPLGDSNPPDDGNGYLYSPYEYESGYDDSSYYNVSGWNMSYYVGTAFSSGGVCVPTAATNLCMYWARRDWNRYGSLRLGNWHHTFYTLYDYMETDDDIGTYLEKVPDAMLMFFGDVGIDCISDLQYGTNSGRDVVAELRNDRPCLLGMNSHPTYGNHTVLALGFAEFTYGGYWNDPSSTYIRVADGWSETPNRYVWGNCYGTWNMIRVIPL